MDPVIEGRDEWLMAQVANGKRDRLELLIQRYANPLFAFIHRMIGNRHRSEELFQEVFFTLWNKRAQYEYPRPFKSWLFAIAVNKCHEAARIRDPGYMPLDDSTQLAQASAPSAEDRAIATETAALVATAVLQLPAQQRSIVVLRVWQGLSYSEIAQIVGRTEATVRSHMHHGLTGLRKYLEPRLA